ncbi:PREDICTED: acid sphingomyelinase-like phosphodiesterase 3b [Nicrophorus vespilloides]|uniref:Acid sphingomyelinase-like phosphodiesterase 3b n=1 Tax=Nicrophorus vespilloides TaxID=110193 RepID=A0ABM1MWX4_NICVS|nr:PREDICTED: acid sphingomyelinase-like phosphodiesterase 3b [Nicrophorus vespilloides]
MWSRWLPTDSMTTFDSGGYYMIERKMLKLQIVVLNTNLMKKGDADEEARRQWDWLNAVLHKCHATKQTVYLVGHMPPGSDERQRAMMHQAHFAYSEHHNKRYLKLVRKYADIIVGQFFGHLHSDSFRVIYNEHGRPVSWAMLAPAVTPRRTTDGANNPGLRLYKFDKDSGQVLDYTQYYLDLPLANTNTKTDPEWMVEYNFSSYYGISNITPLSLHNLAEKLTQSTPTENPSFNRYYRANSVRMYSGGVGGCDSNCAHTHYCAITRVDYEEYDHCVKTAASALASSSSADQSQQPTSFVLILPIIAIIAINRV